MRYLAVFVFCFFLVPQQSHACLGHFAETTLFFKTIPSPPPDADVVAKVTLLNVNDDGATAEVMQVIKATGEKVQQGDIIALSFRVSSCGPSHKSGNEGIIIAKTGADSAGRFVFYPYIYRDNDGKFWPPSVRKQQ